MTNKEQLERLVQSNPELVLQYKNGHLKDLVVETLLNLIDKESKIHTAEAEFLHKKLEKTNVLIVFGALGSCTGYLNLTVEEAKSRYSSSIYSSDDYFYEVFEDELNFYGF